MYEFISTQNHKLQLDLVGQGINFFYITGQDRNRDVFQVGQSWAGIMPCCPGCAAAPSIRPGTAP